jgi:hypothetical protein
VQYIRSSSIDMKMVKAADNEAPQRRSLVAELEINVTTIVDTTAATGRLTLPRTRGSVRAIAADEIILAGGAAPVAAVPADIGTVIHVGHASGSGSRVVDVAAHVRQAADSKVTAVTSSDLEVGVEDLAILQIGLVVVQSTPDEVLAVSNGHRDGCSWGKRPGDLRPLSVDPLLVTISHEKSHRDLRVRPVDDGNGVGAIVTNPNSAVVAIRVDTLVDHSDVRQMVAVVPGETPDRAVAVESTSRDSSVGRPAFANISSVIPWHLTILTEQPVKGQQVP